MTFPMMHCPPPKKDQLGRTAGRTWEGGPGYPPPPEGPAGKDCWKYLGRRAQVPPSPQGPAGKDLGRRAQYPPPPKDQLGRPARRTWVPPPKRPARKDCWRDLGRRAWAPPPPRSCKYFTFYQQAGGGPSTERHSCLTITSCYKEMKTYPEGA